MRKVFEELMKDDYFAIKIYQLCAFFIPEIIKFEREAGNNATNSKILRIINQEIHERVKSINLN